MGSIWQKFNKNMLEDENKKWDTLENNLKTKLQKQKDNLSQKSNYIEKYEQILWMLNEVVIECKTTFIKVMSARSRKKYIANNGTVNKLNNMLEKCYSPLSASDCSKVLSVLGAPKLINLSGWNNNLRKLCGAYCGVAKQLAELTGKNEKKLSKKYEELCKILDTKDTNKGIIKNKKEELMKRYVDWLLIAYKKSNNEKLSLELVDERVSSVLDKNIRWLTNCILAQSVVALIHLVKNCKCTVDNVFNDLQKRTYGFTYSLIAAKKGGITPVDALRQENDEIALPYLMWTDKMKLLFSKMENLPNEMPADAALVCLLFESRESLESTIKEMVNSRYEDLQIGIINEKGLDKLFKKKCLIKNDKC